MPPAKKKASDGEPVYSLFVHRNNVLKMLRLRKYVVPEEELGLIDNYEEFKVVLKEGYDPKETRTYLIDKDSAPDEEREIVVVRYIGNKKMSDNDFISELENPGLHYIFIAADENNAPIDDTKIPGISHEVFAYGFFAIYAPEHFLSGIHTPMNEYEKFIFLARTSFSEDYLTGRTLPRISDKDAMVRYLGIRTGDLVRTETKDSSLKFYFNKRIYFRMVANVPILYTTSETMEGEQEAEDDDEVDDEANNTQTEDLSEV